MLSKTLTLAVIVVVIAIGAAALLMRSPASPGGSQLASTVATTVVKNTTNSTRVLLSSTSYAPYSYQVYPGQMSQEAQAAMAGFNLTSVQSQNGTDNVTVKVIGTSQFQSFLIKPGYKLYVIETTLGDDSYNFDSSLGDDGFVVVDSSGYVV